MYILLTRFLFIIIFFISSFHQQFVFFFAFYYFSKLVSVEIGLFENKDKRFKLI